MMNECLTWFPYKWIRRTQYIPRFGGVLQEMGILLGGCLTCEELDMFKVVSGICPTCVIDLPHLILHSQTPTK